MTEILFDIIVATDINGGISKNNDIPWRCKDDIEFFKNITTNNIDSNKKNNSKNIVIMGYNTFNSIYNRNKKNKSILKNRINIVITNNHFDEVTKIANDIEELFCFNNLDKSLELCQTYTNPNVFLIGGKELYMEGFKHNNLRNVYLTYIKENFQCDNFIVPPILELINEIKNGEFEITNVNNKTDKEESKLIKYNISSYKIRKNYAPGYNAHSEFQYLDLLHDILTNGTERKGRNGFTKSLFGRQLRFNLDYGFPLLTTKKMFTKGIIEELLFFIRGDTDSKLLENKGVNIWKGNTSKEFLEQNNLDYKEGMMGPMYGYQ